MAPIRYSNEIITNYLIYFKINYSLINRRLEWEVSDKLALQTSQRFALFDL